MIEKEEKTLMMIVGQEGGAPKWRDRAWASKKFQTLASLSRGWGGEEEERNREGEEEGMGLVWSGLVG